MNKDYNFKEIEKKWQDRWEKEEYGKSEDLADKPKHYHLVEFPYPSGAGLHVGHCMGYGASDAYCRMKRMRGFNVMYPIGWDAFGLPTENYAIKHKIKPAIATKENVDNFRKQMKALGLSFDWNREVNTTDPDYYRWTQWIFLQFYKHAVIDGKLVKVADDDHATPRLAFQAEMPVNWCPSCKVVLANEEVIAGNCERCGTQTEKRKQKQWMLRITAYADRLIKDLDEVDYLEKIKTQQINWIGRSVGAEVDFEVKSLSNTVADEQIKVFTTRPDTLFGATYVVLAPEHPLVAKLGYHIQNFEEVQKYVKAARKKSDLERTELQKDKTGVKLYGVFAINPVNKEEIPIFVADYVLSTYGTGAIMAVPAHDERDWDFAKKHNIEIRQVIAPLYTTKNGPDSPREDKETEPRKMVTVIIKHWSENKVYCLDWEKFDWHSFILGGIEAGESGEDAAKREAIEESGYKNIKSVKKIGFETHSSFFARHKDVNRYSIAECYVVTLADGDYVEPEWEHVKNHKGKWIENDKVADFINLDNNAYCWDVYQNGERAFPGNGILINSAGFDNLDNEAAKEQIIKLLERDGTAKKAINFKLRDWIFSRQHYWGEPIPIVHCDKCGTVPIAEEELPITLPEVENYEPTNTGESPLAKINDWVNTTCPRCGGSAKRETDTMPNWAGSSWYFLRYCDPHNNQQLADDKKLDYWMPVDLYNGGMEHTTLHLLYSRFWHKFLFDLGVVSASEPYAKRIAHGIILGPDGRKMSKSFGNVINPDDIASEYGADTLRAYVMFIGPYDQESAWSKAGVQGVFRFLKRVWIGTDIVKNDIEDSKELLIKLNQTIDGVSDDLENFRLNTYIAKLMELNNLIEKVGFISKGSYQKFMALLFPAVPHIASEIWESLSFEGRIELSSWPEVDKRYLVAESIEVVVQINGKVRGRLAIKPGLSDDELKSMVLDDEKIKSQIKEKEITKTIIVPDKLISIVVKG